VPLRKRTHDLLKELLDRGRSIGLRHSGDRATDYLIVLAWPAVWEWSHHKAVIKAPANRSNIVVEHKAFFKPLPQ
jgi:hypothetical protein